MSYGCAADAVDEYIQIGESTTRLCLEKFVDEIISLFEDVHLRRPTPEDLQQLLDNGEMHGFPRMMGSIDCMQWEWKNCPTAWEGQYSRGSKKPTIVLEAIASHDLWIWHAFFGLPGTPNDLNVLDCSPVFNDILQGQALKVNYFVNEHQYDMGYYLTDGIYPNWATFIQSIRLSQDPKAELFAKRQEVVRKDVECAFRVLQAWFAIIKNPSLVWDKKKMGKIMRACIILHNMIVEDERDKYTQYDVSQFQQVEGNGSTQVDFTYSRDIPSNLENILNDRLRLHVTSIHQQLKTDLVEHIWENFGPMPSED